MDASRFVIRDIYNAINLTAQAASLDMLGAFGAYALGQLGSMLLRSEILAASVGLVLSVVLSGWIAIVWLWDLSVWLFVLPIVISAMLATWLRAPEWITNRKSWRGWWKPLLAVAVPILFVAIYLPHARRIPEGSYRDGAGWLASQAYRSMAGLPPIGDTRGPRNRRHVSTCSRVR